MDKNLTISIILLFIFVLIFGITMAQTPDAEYTTSFVVQGIQLQGNLYHIYLLTVKLLSFLKGLNILLLLNFFNILILWMASLVLLKLFTSFGLDLIYSVFFILISLFSIRLWYFSGIANPYILEYFLLVLVLFTFIRSFPELYNTGLKTKVSMFFVFAFLSGLLIGYSRIGFLNFLFFIYIFILDRLYLKFSIRDLIIAIFFVLSGFFLVAIYFINPDPEIKFHFYDYFLLRTLYGLIHFKMPLDFIMSIKHGILSMFSSLSGCIFIIIIILSLIYKKGKNRIYHYFIFMSFIVVLIGNYNKSIYLALIFSFSPILLPANIIFKKKALEVKTRYIIISLLIMVFVSEIAFNFSRMNRKKCSITRIYTDLMLSSIAKNSYTACSDEKNYYMIRYAQLIMDKRKDIKLYRRIYPKKYLELLKKDTPVFYDRDEELFGFIDHTCFPAGIMFCSVPPSYKNDFNLEAFLNSLDKIRYFNEQEENFRLQILFRLMQYYYYNDADKYTRIVKLIGKKKIIFITEYTSFIYQTIKRGDIERAENDLMKMISSQGEIYFAHYLLGLIKYRKNDLDAALKNFQIAYDIYPYFTKSSYFIVRILFEKYQVESKDKEIYLDRAFSLIKRNASALPWYPEYVLLFVEISLAKGKNKNILLPALDRLYNNRPINPIQQIKLAELYGLTGDKKKKNIIISDLKKSKYYKDKFIKQLIKRIE